MAPTIPGVSRLCQCEDQLITALSNITEFQTFTGTGSPAAALAKIFVNELPAPASALDDEYTIVEYDAIFPCVTIMEGEGGGIEWEHTADGGPEFGMIHHTQFTLRFEALRSAVGTNEDRHRFFKDQVHTIIEKLNLSYLSSRVTHEPATREQPQVETGNERMRLDVFIDFRNDS